MPTVNSARNTKLRLLPAYLREAAARYQSVSIRHARETIALALATAEFVSELTKDILTLRAEEYATKKLTLRILTKELPTPINKGMASRLFAVSLLCEESERLDLKLDGIRSQGTLFALTTVFNQARKREMDFSLAEAIADAEQLKIVDFRNKWKELLGRRERTSLPIGQILRWLEKIDDETSLHSIAQATADRISIVASSQLNSAKG